MTNAKNYDYLQRRWSQSPLINAASVGDTVLHTTGLWWMPKVDVILDLSFKGHRRLSHQLQVTSSRPDKAGLSII